MNTGILYAGRLDAVTTVTCDTLIENTPSSKEYKDYEYIGDTGTATPRLTKFKYLDSFTRALGRDPSQERLGWLWEDVASVFPDACSQREEKNYETGQSYTQKYLRTRDVEMLIIDALVGRVTQLEKALGEIMGKRKR